MGTVILTLHIILAVFLIGVILLQRSEGGALGIGGGGGGGLMGGRSAASALTKTTVVLAAGFFATSFGLGFLSETAKQPTESVTETLDEQGAAPTPSGPAEPADESPASESEESTQPAPTPEPPAEPESGPEKTPSPPDPR